MARIDTIHARPSDCHKQQQQEEYLFYLKPTIIRKSPSYNNYHHGEGRVAARAGRGAVERFPPHLFFTSSLLGLLLLACFRAEPLPLSSQTRSHQWSASFIFSLSPLPVTHRLQWRVFQLVD